VCACVPCGSHPPGSELAPTPTHLVAARAQQLHAGQDLQGGVSAYWRGMHVCCMRTCVRASLRACVHGCMHACAHAHLSAYVRACVRACMCVHACVHACVRACVRAFMLACQSRVLHASDARNAHHRPPLVEAGLTFIAHAVAAKCCSWFWVVFDIREF